MERVDRMSERYLRMNRVLVADLAYIKLRSSEFIYLAVEMDVYTRIIRGWALLRSLAVELSLMALKSSCPFRYILLF